MQDSFVRSLRAAHVLREGIFKCPPKYVTVLLKTLSRSEPASAQPSLGNIRSSRFLRARKPRGRSAESAGKLPLRHHDESAPLRTRKRPRDVQQFPLGSFPAPADPPPVLLGSLTPRRLPSGPVLDLVSVPPDKTARTGSEESLDRLSLSWCPLLLALGAPGVG